MKKSATLVAPAPVRPWRPLQGMIVAGGTERKRPRDRACAGIAKFSVVPAHSASKTRVNALTEPGPIPGWRAPQRPTWRNFARGRSLGEGDVFIRTELELSHGEIHARCTCPPCGDAIFVAGDGSPRRRPGDKLSRAMRQTAMPSISGGVSAIAQRVPRRLQRLTPFA